MPQRYEKKQYQKQLAANFFGNEKFTSRKVH